ncbi:fatty acyl-CoA reductase 1-like [Maniola jurtina]|uniref:fatty acyl-CoA reductase 1-like n=1 Tax=Maniola jurtina TaxID=191418 RepID=UPI001E68FA2F|nr:fatty acyl-CoA reductase 1-like [Maniola jurtina]
MSSIGVVDFYADKTIFITGASGFIGKILIEKLLRCCPDIKVIYLLLRKKKEQSPRERLNEIINTRCFEKISDRSVFSKLCVIPGDILEEDLGISAQDRSILQKEVQIVFHSAASVRFDMNLRDAVTSNVIGTKRVLELAEEIENLEVFVDISTSFCHDELKVVEEKVYPSLHRPQDIMDCVRWMSDEMLMKIQPELIRPYVNTYGYSKNLTEDVVSQYRGKFPIAIARPSMVVATYKEPMPGWVDNINGPTGVLYAGASGILHTSYCKEDTSMDMVPVDVVVNGCILLAYITGMERPKDIKVCHITDSGTTKITWYEVTDQLKEYVLQYPPSRVLYYPAGSAKKVRYQHKIAEFLFHIVPAYFVDLLLFLLGQKTFMVRIEKRLRKGTELLQYYTSRTWVFKNDYFQSLKNQINEKENEIFYTDLSKIDNAEYLKNYHLGVRKFIAKEDLSTLPQARRHMKRLYYLHMTLKTLFYVLLAYACCLLIKYFF